MIWPEAVIETLRAGVAEGQTGGQIAQRIALNHSIVLTRNAVIGKMARLGLKSHNKPVAINKQVRRKRKQAQKLERGAPKNMVESLLQLGPSDCRWPGETAFCGQLAIPGAPYCADHCRMAYVPVRRAAGYNWRERPGR